MFNDNSFSDVSRGDSSGSVSNEIRKQQLKELNNELIKENALLRSQFEEAVEITAQLQDLHEKNQELVQQVRATQAEKEDLEHRIDICLATNKELTRRLNEEKKNRSQQNDTNINAMNNEIERIKEQSKQQLDSVLEELEKCKAIHEKDLLQQKTIVGRIDRVLQSGERFFQVKFNTVDDLIDYFERPNQSKTQASGSQQTNDVQPLILQPQQANEHLEKRLKHLKAKLRTAAHEKSDLQAELAKAQREVHVTKLDCKQQVNDLNAKIASLREERNNDNAQRQNKINILENQVETLKAEINKYRNNGIPVLQPPVVIEQHTQQQQQQPQRDSSLPKPIKKANTAQENERIIQLQKNIDDLTDKLKTSDKKKSDLEFKLHENELQLSKQKGQMERLNTEISTLRALNQSNASEIDSLRKALHTKNEPIQPEQIQPPRQPVNVQKYQRAIEEQKGKILSLNQLIDKLKKQIETQEKEIESLNEKNELANAATRKVRDDFADYRSKVESKRPLTADDLLPPDAFRCTEFDALLTSCISKIAGNPSLQPISKIQSCFKAIAAHFGKQLNELQSAFDDTMKENQFLSASFNKFIVDLSIALSDQPTTIEDFFKGQGGQQLIEKIADFRVRYDDMKHQNDKFQEVTNRLDEMFGCTGDPVAQITEMKNTFNSHMESLAQKTAKLKKMRRDLREVVSAAETCKVESAQKIEDLTNEMNKLASQLTQLEKTTKNLKQENQSLQADLADATVRANQNEEDFKTREQQTINKLNEEHHKVITQLTNKYNELSNQYSELVEEFNAQTDEVHRLDGIIQAEKKQLANKERELTELAQQMKLEAEEAEDRLEREKTELKHTYEHAINQLKDQCDMHRRDVEKMAKTVADNEKQMAIVKAESVLMRKEKIRVEQEMKSLNAKVERERKLLETTFTAKRIAYETELTKKLNDERARFEQEKRRICGYSVEAFKFFFDANASIDEKSYRNVIDMAHDELTKLTQSDAAIRRIICARDGQTTEDAVAQVVMTSA